MQLQLDIVRYILSNGRGGAPVSLAYMRRMYNIHPSKMHDHINRLIDAGYIERVGRDQYVMSVNFDRAVFSYYGIHQ